MSDQINLTSTPTGAPECREVFSGANVTTAPVFVGKAEYEELVPEDQVDIKVGVFFDGTLNNRKNTEARLEHEKKEDGLRHRKAIADKYIESEGSFENDHSNVSRSEPAYETTNEELLKKFSIYIEGIGTENYKSDSTRGAGLGTGSTGVRPKVLKGCKEIVNNISSLGVTKINTLTVDTFGFSRGAAAARNFISEIYKRKGGTKEVIPSIGAPVIIKYEVDYGALGEHLAENGIEIRRLVVRFAGLFDTVASYGVIHYNDTKELNLTAVSKARHTLQLAADDEHRSNFRLTNINSAGSRGKEKFLPGVHSDIGGGYVDNANETVLLNYNSTDLESLKKERKLLIAQGWFKPNEITVVNGWVKNKLSGTRIKLSNRYSFIPLQIMTKYSNDKNVGFNMGRITSDYPIISELTATKARLEDYVFNNGNRMSYSNLLDRPILKMLRNRYFHFSAHYNSIGMGPNREKGIRTRVIQNG